MFDSMGEGAGVKPGVIPDGAIGGLFEAYPNALP
jgi:hypothetical protein